RPGERGLPLDAIISLRGVTKRFGTHTVLEDISFDLPRGKISAIMGPSGTGKSVLLKNIIGLLRPDAGEIWVDGEETVSMGERDLYRVRRKFGVLFQDGALFGSMNIFDNTAFPLREHTNKSEKEIREIVLEKLGLVGMLDHLKKFPGEVSGGMRKRAGLARALVMDPEIVLFYGPVSGLHLVRVSYLDALVRKIQEEVGATFFIITHNIPSVMRTADYIGVLFRSRLVRFASKDDMVTSEDPIIRQFLAGRAKGPIGMDELATEQSEIERELVEREERRLAGDTSADEIMTVQGPPRAGEGAVPRAGDRQPLRRLARGRASFVGREALVEGVHPPVLVHREGDDAAEHPHLHPVRCGDRAARGDVLAPTRRGVEHRRGDGARHRA